MPALFALAGLLAIGDWLTLWRSPNGERRSRWLTKLGPVVVLILIAALDGLDRPRTPAAVWIVVGLALSLAGDASLLLPERWFVAGLGCFLLAHLAYVVGMLRLDLTLWAIVVATVGVVGAMSLIGRRVVAGAVASEPAMRIPVSAYLIVISTMVVVAVGTGEPWLIAAAATFYVSDAILGWNRFVAPVGWMPLAVMVTYHLAQAGFVAFLVTG